MRLAIISSTLLYFNDWFNYIIHLWFLCSQTELYFVTLVPDDRNKEKEFFFATIYKLQFHWWSITCYFVIKQLQHVSKNCKLDHYFANFFNYHINKYFYWTNKFSNHFIICIWFRKVILYDMPILESHFNIRKYETISSYEPQ